MTWPLPDRPKLPPAPTREEREAARRRQQEASDDGQLPRGVRRRPDGTWHTPYWRRDEVWIVGGMILSFLLLVGFLVYFTNGAPTDPGTDSGGSSPPKYLDGGHLTPFWWVVAILVILFVVAIAGWVVWAVVHMIRDDGVHYDELSEEEQARRREVARLLKQVEPPVTFEAGSDGESGS